MMETAKENPSIRVRHVRHVRVVSQTRGALERQREVPARADPDVERIRRASDFDDFWQRQAIVPRSTQVTVPTLNVAGWWDQEDFYGPSRSTKRSRSTIRRTRTSRRSARGITAGGTRATVASSATSTSAAPTAKYFRDSIELPFFDYYLKDKGNLKQPEALRLRVGGEPVADVRRVAAEDGRSPREALLRANMASCRSTRRRRRTAFDELRVGPEHPGAISRTARSRRTTIRADRAGTRGSWRISASSTDRPDVLSLAHGAADRRRDDRRRSDGEVVREHDGDRRRLDRQADRRLSGGRPGDPKMGGYQFMVSNDVFRARYREGVEASTAAGARQGRRRSSSASTPRLPVQEGPPDHGAGPEHAGSRSSIATRRHFCRTSSRRRRRTIRRRRSRSTGPPVHPSSVVLPVVTSIVAIASSFLKGLG